MYDIAIIGKGPAGMSAAVNAFIRNKKVIIFGVDSRKLIAAPSIPNYLGFPEISGSLLIEKFKQHISSLNIEASTKKVTSIFSMGEYFTIQAENDMIDASTVILAVGVDYKKSIEGEDRFLGAGVSYCATCDAPLYRGRVATVIGYNEDAYKEANFLSEICSKVNFVPVYKSELPLNNNVEVINDIPLSFEGEMNAKSLHLRGTTIESDGFFVIKDTYPLTSLVPGLNAEGPHVIVNNNMETNIKGLFAAGDAVGKPYQIAKAVGQGQIAALAAVEYLGKEKK